MSKRKLYDCSDCLAWCCTVYDAVAISERDAGRLASALGMPLDAFLLTYIHVAKGGDVLLKRKFDPAFGECCFFLDTSSRRCTVYEARPQVCRDFPNPRHSAEGARGRCAYWDLYKFARQESHDERAIPLIQIKRLVRK